MSNVLLGFPVFFGGKYHLSWNNLISQVTISWKTRERSANIRAVAIGRFS